MHWTKCIFSLTEVSLMLIVSMHVIRVMMSAIVINVWSHGSSDVDDKDANHVDHGSGSYLTIVWVKIQCQPCSHETGLHSTDHTCGCGCGAFRPSNSRQRVY